MEAFEMYACYIFGISFERWENRRASAVLVCDLKKFAAVLALGSPRGFFSKKNTKKLGFYSQRFWDDTVRPLYVFFHIVPSHTTIKQTCNDNRDVCLIKCIVSVINVTFFFLFFRQTLKRVNRSRRRPCLPPNSTHHYHHPTITNTTNTTMKRVAT